jgi:hypothetical protein
MLQTEVSYLPGESKPKGREYPRLRALVMANQSAESLMLVELLRLAEDPAAPPGPKEAYRWAQQFALPMIRELHRRLAATAKQVDYKPELIATLRMMRQAQIKSKQRLTNDQREFNTKSLRALEDQVDRLISDETQPSLFAGGSQ